MKIGSLNVRGLGSLIKKDEVLSFFIKHQLDICCLQETKIALLTQEEGRKIWKSEGV